MSDHAPGPWQAVLPRHQHADGEYLCVQIGEDELYTTLEVKPADAHLMAAAPEMLESLEAEEAVRLHFRTCHNCGADLSGNVWFCATWSKLTGHANTLRCAAVRKARGEAEPVPEKPVPTLPPEERSRIG